MVFHKPGGLEPHSSRPFWTLTSGDRHDECGPYPPAYPQQFIETHHRILLGSRLPEGRDECGSYT